MNRPFAILVCVAAAWGAVSGCLPDTSGIDPPDDALIYPVGAALVSDDHLVVANSNFDLRYNSGTLVVVDVAPVFADAARSAAYDAASAVVTIPEAQRDAYCDGGWDRYTCWVHPQRLIDADKTIRLGAYASDLALTPAKDRVAIPVRGERAVLLVDVDREDGGVALSCGQGKDRTCDADHRVTGDGDLRLPIEPYAVAFQDYTYTSGDAQVTETIGFVTHRAGGEVSMFSAAHRTQGGPAVFDNAVIAVRDGVIPGAAGIAADPHTGDVLLVGQSDPTPHVAVMRVYADLEKRGSLLEDPWFSQAATVSLTAVVPQALEPRSIAVSPDGKWAFVTVQSPPMVLKIDLQRRQVVDMATVCTESASVIAYAPSGAGAGTTVAVACFLTDEVYFIDADTMTASVRSVGRGPQDLVWDAQRNVVYVVEFTDSTISMVEAQAPHRVVQVDAGDGRRVLRIGDAQSGEDR